MPILSEKQEQLQRLAEQLEETKRRLPKHSVKPQLMMELLELEDKHEVLLAEIRMAGAGAA